jgi:thymidylate synthase (FAD)
MKIVKPTFEILGYTPNMTNLIERGIRTAYKSEDKIGEGSDVEIIERIKNFKHESTLEHGSITLHFVTDRGVTHELVRHRLASFTQESTRYCNYGKGKFGSEITVMEPFFFTYDMVTAKKEDALRYGLWEASCLQAETQYMALLGLGAKPQEARSVLPNSLKTEIVMTANPREWRHVMKLRTTREAHPQIRQIMCPALVRFREMWPVLFNDVGDIEHESPATEVFGSYDEAVFEEEGALHV